MGTGQKSYPKSRSVVSWDVFDTRTQYASRAFVRPVLAQVGLGYVYKFVELLISAANLHAICPYDMRKTGHDSFEITFCVNGTKGLDSISRLWVRAENLLPFQVSIEYEPHRVQMHFNYNRPSERLDPDVATKCFDTLALDFVGHGFQ